MNIFNCHTHTENSHDCNTSLHKLCDIALEQNLLGFAITDHCDCEYYTDNTVITSIDNSFHAANEAKKKYKNKLIISCGVEIGEAIFQPDFAKRIISRHPWDVILGSVHAVRIKGYDIPFSLIDFSAFSDDFIRFYTEQYFQDVLEMSKNTDYDILCHLTVVLRYIVYKYKKSIDISQFYPVINEILKVVIKRDKTLEINTSGITDGYFMPDKDIINMYKENGGKRLTVGSDAHTPDSISSGLENAAQLLRSMGFDTLTYYIQRKPVEYKI